MTIKFACPNGHPLSCPDVAAGRRGKCPDCGASVLIPHPGADNGADTGSSPSGKEDAIVFLCPNGHRLHGPRSLEGKPGQCPHCNARFRVPHHDDPPDEDEPKSQILVGALPSAGELAVESVDPFEAGSSEEPFFNFTFEESGKQGKNPDRGSTVKGLKRDTQARSAPAQPAAQRSPPDPAAIGGLGHPLADLFATLWDERSRGAFVELHLDEGVVIVPERFARDASAGRHGVFAVKESDGTFTLTVVAWDAVQRISVRRVGKLPRKMFD